MANEKRVIPKRALTQKQIRAMSDKELLSHMSPEERQLARMNARMSGIGDKPPGKRPDESDGQYQRRCREAARVDAEERQLHLRHSFESTLLGGKAQKHQQLVDALAGTVTPESIKQRKEAEAQRAERDRQRDLESGDSYTPLGMGLFSGWNLSGTDADKKG